MTDLFDTDSSSGKTPAPDKVELNGEVVATRNSMQKSIERRAQEQSISLDDAWEQISREILAYHSKPGTDKKELQPQATAGKRGGEATVPFIMKKGGVFHLNFNGTSLDDLSDDILPKELRDLGYHNIMEALASGKLKIDGESHVADLLSQTVTYSNDVTDASVQRAADAKKQLMAVSPAMQYPLMRRDVRVMPSDFNRTSLFHVGSNNLPRRYCKNEKLGQIGTGVTIFYHGEELRQTDEAIFRQLVFMARGKRPWEEINLSQCSFIRDAKGTGHRSGRRLGAKDLKEVHDILMRLRSGLLLIKSKKRGFMTCNLIKEYDGNGTERRLIIDPRVVLLFDSYAAIEEKVSSELSSIAAKIYSYLATVPATGLYPILVTSFFEFCYGGMEYLEKEYLRRNPTQKDGAPSTKRDAELSVQKKLSDFKRKGLPNALDELKDKGLVATWAWEEKNTKVSITKNPETNALVTEASTDDEEEAA